MRCVPLCVYVMGTCVSLFLNFLQKSACLGKRNSSSTYTSTALTGLPLLSVPLPGQAWWLEQDLEFPCPKAPHMLLKEYKGSKT